MMDAVNHDYTLLAAPVAVGILFWILSALIQAVVAGVRRRRRERATSC
jgi:hypothetical protein